MGAAWSSAAPVRTTGEPGSAAATPCPLTSRISGERMFGQVYTASWRETDLLRLK